MITCYLTSALSSQYVYKFKEGMHVCCSKTNRLFFLLYKPAVVAIAGDLINMLYFINLNMKPTLIIGKLCYLRYILVLGTLLLDSDVPCDLLGGQTLCLAITYIAAYLEDLGVLIWRLRVSPPPRPKPLCIYSPPLSSECLLLLWHFVFWRSRVYL